MRRVIDIIFLIALGLAIFYYRDTIGKTWEMSFQHYFPCKSTIKYSLGDFDDKFGITQTEFLQAVTQAEKIWEGSINKNLFEYKEGGELKINLVYDERQSTTERLRSMGLTINNSKTSYNALKEKYNSLVLEYEQAKSSFESKLSDFEKRRTAYEAEVKVVNSKGGANKQTIARLSTLRDALNENLLEIKVLQNDLNIKVDSINALADSLNNLAKNLNLTVSKFNTIGESLGPEFEEGTYIQDKSGRKIYIYQFENRTKLVRVLAHEFGHALGLDHNDDTKAIMYRLNNGINEKPTQTDISALKTLCKIR